VLLNGLSQGRESDTVVNVLDVSTVLGGFLGTCGCLSLALLLVSNTSPFVLLLGRGGRGLPGGGRRGFLGGSCRSGSRLGGRFLLGSSLGLDRSCRSGRLRSEDRESDTVSSSGKVGPGLGSSRCSRSGRFGRGSGLCGLSSLLCWGARGRGRFGVLGLLALQLLLNGGGSLGGGLGGGLRGSLRSSPGGLRHSSSRGVLGLDKLGLVRLRRVIDSCLFLGLLGNNLVLNLLAKLGGILLDGNRVLGAGQCLVLDLFGSSRGRFLDSSGLLGCVGLVLLVNDVTENVVQHKVAVGLGAENKCLSELLVRG
jgi:hypothetical protein